MKSKWWKKTIVFPLLICGCMLCSCSGGEEINAYQPNLNVADAFIVAEIRPEDDFYGYTNFDFLWNNNIPGNMTEYSYATMVESETDKFLSEEIIRLGESEEKFSLGSDNQKIKDLYLQYLDTEDREKAEKLNMEDYKQVYHDYPSVLLLKTDKENISQQLKNQFVDKGADFKTAEEYYEQKEQESSSITSVLNALIFLGIALAVISVIGNQSIGFEQRKREFAVLYSAGMSRRQLIQMIITELAALAVVSTIISVLSGTVIVKSLSWLLVVLELSIPAFFYVDEILIFIAVLFAVIMFTGMIPVRALLKMNTSKQLKYE